MSFLESIFNEQFVYALGWTLIHSLWQGALIGLVIAIAMVFMHRYSARLRYFIYSISLLVLAGLAVVTFISSYANATPDKNQTTDNTIIYNTTYAISGAQSSPGEIGRSPLQNVLMKTAAYCRNHIPLFVMIWLLGMLAFMLRFLGGYALVRRYRSHRVKAVTGEWEERFSDLTQRIKLKRRVRLLESALIKVPMAIGYLKPVILLPLGALNGVSVEQMEAILTHELAHIHRRDYLINIIQSLMEVAFFYHPVVWWLSKNIRIERENICDDIAITITGNTMEFAKALTNIQEFNLSAPGLAAGLSGRGRNRLVSRIRRITGKPRLQSGYAEGFIAAFILVVSLIGLSAAAMITYPVDKEMEETMLIFEAPMQSLSMEIASGSSATLPDSNKTKQTTSITANPTAPKEVSPPDSTEIMEKEFQEFIEAEEALEQMEVEMEALEAEAAMMQAEAEYLRQMERYPKEYFEQANQAAEQARAMQEYRRALEGYEYLDKTNPYLFLMTDSIVYMRDSSVWSFYLPDQYVEFSDSLFDFYSDSLSEYYIDNWKDQFVDMQEFQLQLQEQTLLMAEEIDAMEELYEARALENAFLFEIPEVPEIPEFYIDFGDMSQSINIIQEELYADGLIDKDRDYIFQINEKQMFINGEKQSRANFKKYRRLADSLDELDAIEDEDGLKIHIKH